MTVSSMSTTVHDELRSRVAGRVVVLATVHPAAGESILRRLHELDAARIIVLGPPSLARPAIAADAELVEVDLDDEDSAVTQQYWTALLANPPSGLRNLLDARDPDRTALVLVSPRLATAELLGRPVFGAQHPDWPSHADTLLAERLWARAGIAESGPGGGRGGTHPEA